MSKISALTLGQHKEIRNALYGKKAEKRCKICGKPIAYNINKSDTCMECYKPE